jgi:squalene-hopene/tetraprenyl-beta-curcumene cyclase
MFSFLYSLTFGLAWLLNVASGFHPAVSAAQPKPPVKPWLNKSDEPKAQTFSLARGAEVLDEMTLAWIEKHTCASCHTGYPYLMASRSMGDSKAQGILKVRKFFEDRVSEWDKEGRGKGYLVGEGIIEKSEGITEVVAIAATLAIDDAQSTGKLHPKTRLALDRIWELQQPDGAWNWNKEMLKPVEYDDYFGAVYAALGVGLAPGDYANSPGAKEGVAGLKAYLKKNPPPNLHHKTFLLWAALNLDGLMTVVERDKTVKELLAIQGDDGGWNLPSLGDWNEDGRVQSKKEPSDGYATGLIVYVLRQAGVPAKHEALQRGVEWLKTNQRSSGRWFTRSLNERSGNLIANAGTAYVLMALKACDVSGK